MSKNRMAHGLPTVNKPEEHCHGCLMSKQTRKSFPSQTNFSVIVALELLHMDLCGPITPATPAGNRYFMLIVDDFTRMIWVYMLKTKDEALNKFKTFKLAIENGVKQGIKVLRTDRGGEFCSREF